MHFPDICKYFPNPCHYWKRVSLIKLACFRLQIGLLGKSLHGFQHPQYIPMNYVICSNFYGKLMEFFMGNWLVSKRPRSLLPASSIHTNKISFFVTPNRRQSYSLLLRCTLLGWVDIWQGLHNKVWWGTPITHNQCKCAAFMGRLFMTRLDIASPKNCYQDGHWVSWAWDVYQEESNTTSQPNVAWPQQFWATDSTYSCATLLCHTWRLQRGRLENTRHKILVLFSFILSLASYKHSCQYGSSQGIQEHELRLCIRGNKIYLLGLSVPLNILETCFTYLEIAVNI